ncbi:MAG: arylsulfatase, partial [bacterium]|nr:arylsulfatase [bacterium]
RVPLLVSWPGSIKPNTRTAAMVSWIDILPTLIDLAGGEAPTGIDGRSFAGVLRGEEQEHRAEIFTTHSGDGVMNVYPIRGVRAKRYKYILNLLPDSYHSNHSDILRKDRAGAYWDSWDKAAETDPEAAAIIRRYHVRPAEELYDLRNDPLERNNLATDPSHGNLLKELKGKLERWMEAQGDRKTVFNEPYPVSGPRPTAETVRRN